MRVMLASLVLVVWTATAFAAPPGKFEQMLGPRELICQMVDVDRFVVIERCDGMDRLHGRTPLAVHWSNTGG